MKRFILCTLLWSSFFFSSLVLADEPILVIDPQGHSAQITNVMFTPDGKTLVSISHDKAIRLWDVETGDLVKTIRGQIGDGPEGMLFAGALSPDGKILALGGFLSKPGDDPDKNVGQIRLFNVESGEQIGMLKGHENVVFALAFSQDGTWLASGSGDRTVRIWDISGRLIAMLRGHSAPVSDIAFSPDKRKFVSASFDRTLRLRELKKNLQGVEGFDVLQSSYDMEKHSDRVYCVAYAPDGKYLVSGGADGKILLWDGNGKFLKQIDQVQYPIATISFSADSQNIVTSGGTGKSTAVYVIPSGEKLTTFTKHTNTVEALAFYKNGLIATAGGNENDIYIWDASSGAVKTHIVGRGRWVLATAFDDHSRLAFGNSDKSPSDVVLHVLQDYPDYVALEQSFDFTDMSLNHEIPDNTAFKRVQTEYQGKTLERITNYELRITNGGTIRNDRGYDGQIRSYTFPKDGNVVVGSSYTLKLYQNDGMLLREFVGHTGEVWAVSVSEDGRILVSGSDDQTIKLWNLNTGECLATLFVASDNEWVCWTPQGYYAASAGGEKYIGWQINRGMDNAAEYYPVSVFRKQFLHPELVKRTISIGSFEQALKELNAESQQQIKETLVTQVLPSKAQWISPEAGTIETLDSAVRIRAEIDSESKLTDVRVLVNGRPCPEPVPSKIKGLVEGTQATGRGLALGTEDAEIDNMIDREISLTPGNNEITIFAANENAGAMSAKRIVVYRAEGYLPNLYMVSIGISQYQQSELQLEYADDDAKAMSRLFLGQEGALYDKVILKELYDTSATQANVIQAIEWLTNETTQKDVAMIFVAAHGSNEQGKYYLLPADGNPDDLPNTGVSWSVFAEVLGDLPSKVVLFLDTCHSGQLGQNVRAEPKQVDNTEAIRELSSDEYGVVILAASTGREFSMEHPDWGHGAFTKALIEALEQGQADYLKDGAIDLREMDLYVAERVETLTQGEQHPTTQKPSTISRFPIVQLK